MKPELYFNREDHTYTIDGRGAPGITEILRTVGISPPIGTWSEEYLERGQYIHEAIELDLNGRLNPESAPWLMPYVEGSRKWFATLDDDWEVIGAEFLIANPDFWYATCVDVMLKRDHDYLVVNWKSGAPEPWHEVQGMAEIHATYKSLSCARVDAIDVYLNENAGFSPRPCKVSEKLYNVFASACNVYDWIQRSTKTHRPRTISDKTETILLPGESHIFEKDQHADNEHHSVGDKVNGLFD